MPLDRKIVPRRFHLAKALKQSRRSLLLPPTACELAALFIENGPSQPGRKAYRLLRVCLLLFGFLPNDVLRRGILQVISKPGGRGSRRAGISENNGSAGASPSQIAVLKLLVSGAFTNTSIYRRALEVPITERHWMPILESIEAIR